MNEPLDPRAAAEALVRDRDAYARLLLDSTAQGIYGIDLEGRCTFCNAAAARMLGFAAPDELLGRDIHTLAHHSRPDGTPYPSSRCRVCAPFHGGERVHADDEVYWRADGSRFPVEYWSHPVHHGGQVIGSVVAFIDITRRKRTEEALRESELLKGTILESALDCIVAIADDSTVIEWNPAAERTFGYKRHEALGRDLAELIIPAELREGHRQGMARYLATGRGPVLGTRVELEAMHADGSRFPVELAIEAIQVRGKPHFTAYLRDITARKRAEAALRDSEQRLTATYEHAFVGIAEVDTVGRFLRVNEELSRMTGYAREELLGATFSDLTHPEERHADLERFQKQLAGEIGSYTLEKRYIHKAGHTLWVELSASMVHDAAGRPLYGVRVVRDISDRKRGERHQRLLINELNHRVKNTLAMVQAISTQTLRNSGLEPRHREAFEARLMALASAHDVLTRERWESAEIADVVQAALEPHQRGEQALFRVGGARLRIRPKTALALSLALHELSTNATKYGALSIDEGHVEITWEIAPTPQGERFRLRWSEHGGPPVAVPAERGFGSRLIERGLAAEFGGAVRIDFVPTGLVCTIDAPPAAVLEAGENARE